jgi:peptidoglycan/xylan/chitin deacetylase (PgdA/CDA1 family)
MSQTLYVTWTMDCEGIQALSRTSGGPADWALSARAMRGYVESLAHHGHRATLFLTPLVAEHQPDVIRDLQALGAEAGMHLHPQTADFGLDKHLGQFDATMQERLLRESRDRVAAAIGAAPTSFRPGCFSASDATFPILSSLGFTAGSVSLPGRHLPDLAAQWRGAQPFAHWADANDRWAAGDLPLLEMPTSMALADVNRPGNDVGDAQHLRLERDGIGDWGPALLRDYVQRQLETDHWLKTLVIMTHNTREYGSPDESARQALERLVLAIAETAAEFDLQVQPATLSEIRANSRGAGVPPAVNTP